jgi:hypothetical protein
VVHLKLLLAPLTQDLALWSLFVEVVRSLLTKLFVETCGSLSTSKRILFYCSVGDSKEMHLVVFI